MIECDECGTKYEPMTDAYKCPVCGAENYPDDEEEPYQMRHVFTHCNVCGVVLRTESEHRMGMCERCSKE